MTLATNGPDGPWAASLLYVNDGFVLYWLSDPNSRHSQNLARDPRAAVTVHEDYRDWRVIQGLQMEGTADQFGTVFEAEGPMRQYVGKYLFLKNWRDTPAVLADAVRTARVYRFTPSRAFFTDNTRAFGFREEVPLPP